MKETEVREGIFIPEESIPDRKTHGTNVFMSHRTMLQNDKVCNYIHTHTYYIPTCINTYIHIHIYTYIHTYTYLLTHAYRKSAKHKQQKYIIL